MRIRSLSIDGFRNLQKATLNFDADSPVVALVGPNGQGKTNVLESFFLLSLSKSFRTAENEELIGFDSDHLSLRAEAQGAEEPIRLDLIVTRTPARKVLKINGATKKASDYIGTLRAVLFSPDDLGMVHSAPALRRRYLDLLLSQQDRDYLEAALQTQAVLRQRNTLLKQLGEGVGDVSGLDFWDAELAKHGTVLHQKRQSIVERISAFSAPFYRETTGSKDSLSIEYLPSAGSELTPESFLSKLTSARRRDIAVGTTLTGPHRDDLRFLVNGHDLASFGSRGEWRSLVLTLKFAEIDLLRTATGDDPILLLDDVFSELDDRRQSTLFGHLGSCQTFLTTTHLEFLEAIGARKQVFSVETGTIQKL